MKPVIVNLSLFKAAWLATVFGAAASMPLLGLAAVSVAVIVHVARAPRAKSEILLLATAGIFGLVWESLMVATGVLEYPAGMLLPGFAPYWIVAIWILFATTINVGMRWLHKSLLVASLAGAACGPLSFLAGAKAGAVLLADPIISPLVIGIGWAFLLPALMIVARRLEKPELAIA